MFIARVILGSRGATQQFVVGKSLHAGYLSSKDAMDAPSETPKALQASECSELLDTIGLSCWISAEHLPDTQLALVELESTP